MLRYSSRFQYHAAVHFTVPLSTRLSSFKRFASGTVLPNRNIAVVLKHRPAVADLLEAVWNHKVEVIDTELHVNRTIPDVNNDLASAMTFDGFVRLKDTANGSTSTVAINFVRSILEVQNRPKNYVSARARMHSVVENNFEFAHKLKNSEVIDKGKEQIQSQYEVVLEMMTPVHVITICGYAPVCLDLDSFTAAALSANYSHSEIDAIVKAKTRQGKIWYEVDTLYRDHENAVFIKIQPDIHNSDGTTSKALGKKEIKVVTASIPKAVEVVRPVLAESLNGAGNVPSCMADYLSESLSWTFVYIPIIKIDSTTPPSRLCSWADFFLTDTVPRVRQRDDNSMFSRLSLEMSTLPIQFKGWAAEFDEVVERALQAEAGMEAAKKRANEAETEAEAALAAKEVEKKAKEAALAEVERLKKLMMMEVWRT
jgi:hypothetical protein